MADRQWSLRAVGVRLGDRFCETVNVWGRALAVCGDVWGSWPTGRTESWSVRYSVHGERSPGERHTAHLCHTTSIFPIWVTAISHFAVDAAHVRAARDVELVTSADKESDGPGSSVSIPWSRSHSQALLFTLYFRQAHQEYVLIYQHEVLTEENKQGRLRVCR